VSRAVAATITLVVKVDALVTRLRSDIIATVLRIEDALAPRSSWVQAAPDFNTTVNTRTSAVALAFRQLRLDTALVRSLALISVRMEDTEALGDPRVSTASLRTDDVTRLADRILLPWLASLRVDILRDTAAGREFLLTALAIEWRDRTLAIHCWVAAAATLNWLSEVRADTLARARNEHQVVRALFLRASTINRISVVRADTLAISIAASREGASTEVGDLTSRVDNAICRIIWITLGLTLAITSNGTIRASADLILSVPARRRRTTDCVVCTRRNSHWVAVRTIPSADSCNEESSFRAVTRADTISIRDRAIITEFDTLGCAIRQANTNIAEIAGTNTVSVA